MQLASDIRYQESLLINISDEQNTAGIFFFFFQWKKKLTLVKASVLSLPRATGKLSHSQTAKIINTSEKGQRCQDAAGMG